MIYEELLRHVRNNGRAKTDRTGTGTLSVFGAQLRYNLKDEGLPLITTKRVHYKSVVAELLWMLSGSTNVADLRALGCTIWDEWADKNGNLGPVYGFQWRNWSGGPDQIEELVAGLKTNPHSRRHVVSAWAVHDLAYMALAPCHFAFQCDVTDDKLSLQVYQRSADLFLGVPFNLASYGTLAYMLADQCGYDLGDLVWTGGDCHIYTNHIDQIDLQLSRDIRPFPELHLWGRAEDIFSYKPEHFHLEEYNPYPAIKAPVAV